MRRVPIRTVIIQLYLIGWFGVAVQAQNAPVGVNPPVESHSNQILYAPSGDSQLGSIGRVQQFQKLVDEKTMKSAYSFGFQR